MTEAPGRTCPVSYRYPPSVFRGEPQVVADAIYVVGGLYGNLEALEQVLVLAGRERGSRIVFNGDFHWFDVDRVAFEVVSNAVLRHPALRGNVETEIAAEDSGAGCGCAYPMDVSDAEVSHSNEILARLRETARGFPELRRRLGDLPMHLTAQVGRARVGIVHGDAGSLAGWGFAQDQLDRPAHRRWIEASFREAGVDVFASTHTCLPAVRRYALEGGDGVVANNGASGMPNFADSRYGLLTRIGTKPYAGPEKLYGVEVAGVAVDALRIDYDHERFVERFVASWPEGSPAHQSYFNRISRGTRFAIEQALPRAA